MYWRDEADFTATEQVLRGAWRTRLLDEAKAEEPGLSAESVAWVTYERETCASGVQVSVVRPARRNSGSHFTYQLSGVEGHPGYWRPSLKTVFADIGMKIDATPSHARLLFEAVDAVYRCREPDDVLANSDFEPLLALSTGLEVEVLLKLLKWVFLEQDLTYWHTSGRRRPMDAQNGANLTSVWGFSARDHPDRSHLFAETIAEGRLSRGVGGAPRRSWNGRAAAQGIRAIHADWSTADAQAAVSNHRRTPSSAQCFQSIRRHSMRARSPPRQLSWDPSADRRGDFVPGPIPSGLLGDFAKGGIFVEVEFGNMASAFRDLFKFQIASRSGAGRLGVLVVASDRVAASSIRASLRLSR